VAMTGSASAIITIATGSAMITGNAGEMIKW
jgi:hypothetical protein